MVNCDDSGPQLSLELNRAKEALRQVELRLSAQATALAALEARAGAIIGWSVGGSVAAGAALAAPNTPQLLGFAAAGLLAGLTVAALTGLRVILPSSWGVQGHLPRDVERGAWASTEAELLNWLAEGPGKEARKNRVRLRYASRALRRAAIAMAAAPVVALAVMALAWLAGVRN